MPRRVYSVFMTVITLLVPIVVVAGFGTGIDPVFVRGDANNDGLVDNSDPIAILDYYYHGTFTPPCLDSADANDDGVVDGTDSVVLLDYIWNGGPPPSAPFPDCGVDPGEDDELPCLEHTCGD